MYDGWKNRELILIPSECPARLTIKLTSEDSIIDIDNMSIDIKCPTGDILHVHNNDILTFRDCGMYFVEVDMTCENKRFVSDHARFYVM